MGRKKMEARLQDYVCTGNIIGNKTGSRNQIAGEGLNGDKESTSLI